VFLVANVMTGAVNGVFDDTSAVEGYMSVPILIGYMLLLCTFAFFWAERAKNKKKKDLQDHED
jgi:hypothetical protein